METDLRDRAVRDVRAALRGVAASLPDRPVTPDLLLTPLAMIGDALRVEIDLPAPIRAWMKTVPVSDLAGALVAKLSESWSLPEVVRDEDPALAEVVRRRDEGESVLIAARRICVPRGIQADALPELAALSAVLLTTDEALAELLSRADVARLLETRAFLEPLWADTFPERAATDSPRDEGALPSALPVTPSDETVARYVAHGALPKVVEGVASMNLEFAEQLAACIDAAKADGDAIAFVARRWRKQAPARAEYDPLLFSAPAVRLAAADGTDNREPVRIVHLGTLPSVDAEVRMEITPRTVRIQVFPGARSLASVELGATAITAPDAAGNWQVEAALPGGAVPFRVVATDGARFDDDLRFAPGDDVDEAE